MPRIHRLHPLLLLPVIASFAISLTALGGDDLGLDGGLSVALTRLPFPDTISFLAHDVHPPLYYVLLRYWVRLLGATPFVVKLPGALATVLAVALVIGWARSLRGSRTALVAGLVVAFAPVVVEMSATVREFAVALPLVVGASWAYTSRPKYRWWLFVVAGGLALWTSYLSIVVLVAAGVDALVRPERRNRLASVVGAAALLLPWAGFILATGFTQTLRSEGPRQGAVAPNPIGVQLADLARLLTGGHFLTPDWLGPALFGGALVAAGALAAVARREREARAVDPHLLFLVTGAAASLLLALAVNTTWTREGMGVRYVLPAAPFLAVLFALLVDRPKRSAAGVLALVAPALVAGALGSAAWIQHPLPAKSYWDPHSMVDFLDARVKPEDAILFLSPEQVGYYEALSRVHRRWTLVLVSPDYLAGDVPARIGEALPPLIEQPRTIWSVEYRQFLGDAGRLKVDDWLSTRAYPVQSVDLPDSVVAPYLAAAPDLARERLDIQFKDGVVLVEAARPARVAPGDRLPVEIVWQAAEPQMRELSVFAHLVDANWNKVAQHDAIPANGREPLSHWVPGRSIADHHGLFVPLDVAPGEYFIAVGLYDSTGRLPLVAGGDVVRIGPIVVSAAGSK